MAEHPPSGEIDKIFEAIVGKYQSDRADAIKNSDFRDLIDRLATDPTVEVDFTSFGALDKAIADADKDKNGYIDREEFGNLMATGFISAQELARCLEVGVGQASPAVIEPVELPATPGEVVIVDPAKEILGMELYDALSECFTLLDLDKGGTITRQEAHCLLANSASGDRLFAAFDTNSDGQVDISELLNGSAELVSEGACSREELWTEVKMVNKLLRAKREELGANTGTAADLEAAIDAMGTCMGCEEGYCSSLNYYIMTWDRAVIRKVFRALNMMCAILLFTCIGIAEWKGHASDFPGVVLNICLCLWGILIIVLEVRVDCWGIDKWLAHNMTMVYMASGRSKALAFSGLVVVGCGLEALPLGLLIVMNGCAQSYIIGVHPLCGSFFITTDPEYFLTHNNEIIQPSDKFIMDQALRATQAMTPFAFDKFEQELAPIRILQSMDRVRLQKKLDAAGVPSSPEKHANPVKLAEDREKRQANLEASTTSPVAVPAGAQPPQTPERSVNI